MSFWYTVWTQAEVDELKLPFREFMGEDVYGDGKRNFFRSIADDYIADLDAQITQLAALKTVAPYIQNYMSMTVTGHEYSSLNCDESLLTDEAARLNIVVAIVYEELTALKNPAGDTEYMRLHNQSVAAEKLWLKYAGNVLYPCIWKGQFARIECPVKHGLTEGETVFIRIDYDRNGSSAPIGVDDIISDGGRYRVGIIDDYNVFLRDLDGVAIAMPRTSWCLLRIVKENTVPLLHLKLGAEYTGYDIATIECDLIGLYDSAEEFYIITSNPAFSSGALELSSFKMSLRAWRAEEVSPVKQKLYEYPSPHAYQCVHWPIKNAAFGEEDLLKMAVSITGRRLDIPETYGLSLSGLNIISDPLSFGEWMHPNDELKNLFLILPRGFYWFAGKYYDHPIVTGVDSQTPVARSAAEELALVEEINTYVNTHYEYKTDITDTWEFMGSGRTTGDCEDFALTKAQMLLDAGVSVTKLKIDGGYPSWADTDGEEIIIGHAWLLYDNNYVLDSSSNSLKTIAAMLADYPRRITQISGLTWNCEGTTVTIPQSMLWPASSIDIDMFTFDSYLKKLIR